MKRLCVCLLLLLVASTARAQWPMYRSYGEAPSFLDHVPDAVPESIVFPVGVYDGREPFDRLVASVDGTPVRRPLFHSVVTSPVDRALILRDYRRNNFSLPLYQLAAACKRYQRIQFHDMATLRDLRLQKEHATLEDYHRFVSEEIKLATMLYFQVRGAATSGERTAMVNRYLDRLHHATTLEKPPA